MTRLTVTFDNGPHPEITPRVLDLLRERGVGAHFFVVGRQLASPDRRALVSRAVSEGHRVGNHSFSHAVPLGKDARPDAVEAEIVATEKLLSTLAGESRRFRPYGAGGAIGKHLLRTSTVEYLVAHRYTCVLWSSLPRDWEDPQRWVERAIADATKQPHGVVVLHDIPGACSARLGEFLDRMRDSGVEMTQDLPVSCTPIVDGVVVGDLSGLVADD